MSTGKVWVPDKDELYVLGTISNQGPKQTTVTTDSGKSVTVDNDKIYPDNPAILHDVDDLTKLSLLHEPALLHSLNGRYSKEEIYTFSGPILIAINPYKDLPIYSEKHLQIFPGLKRENMEPHVYALAEQAYRAMISFGDQSILVSGESGAGKTETTKYILAYFAAMSPDTSSMSTVESVKDKVLGTTPILEAFGNAKTVRNNNSSRFGKYIQVQFNAGGDIVGANLDTYLLEKSRIVRQAKGERNYHIFYQLIAGCTQQQKNAWGLTSANDFYYLNQSGNTSIDGVNDIKVFGKTKAALNVVGITDQEQDQIFQVLAGILHLGNIKFTTQGGKDDAVVSTPNFLKKACELWGTDLNMITRTLTYKTLSAGGRQSFYNVALTVPQAEGARDALAMLLYSRVFDWLVGRINQSLNNVAKARKIIGVLDIYGFESFDRNSFEQFCINYANEKLQQQFNQHIFKSEQEEYKKEKIEWQYISFDDNQPCLDLIEQTKGLSVLKLLDEECKFPNGTDKSLAGKLATNFASNKYFEKPRTSDMEFIIKHYAGNIIYNVAGFLDKNKDFIIPEQLEAMANSTIAFVSKQLFSDISGSKNPGASAMKFVSVASQFKTSLGKLMETIEKTSPHYIRCIKPNEEKIPNKLDKSKVLDQLRYGGVLESIKICRAGYPTRRDYTDFWERYSILMPGSPTAPKDYKAGVKQLSEFGGLDLSKMQFGVSKVFMKVGMLADFEEKRAHKLGASAVVIQKYIRGYIAREAFAESWILLEKLKDAKNKNAQLKKKYSEVNTKVSEALTKINTLQESNKSIEGQVSQIQSKRGAADANYKKLHEENQQLQQQVNTLKNDLRNMQPKGTTTAGDIDISAPEGTVVLARALHSYNAAQPGDLTFKKGDVITIFNKDQDWWIGHLNGKIGIIPSNYVKIQE
eukprot:TRINITY_DN1014_c0_g1_i1.p1 TRINITY_DN1014_c0_g1~~TRINITY_DN1014_c0_g1_i1.p1  ORF type:complete len:920 (+),score=212.17 TRINITY_DN1014_c0_g1_i1:54-2813(+)